MTQNNHAQLYRTMWLMLTYSWVSLLTIALIFIIFVLAQLGMIAGDVAPERAFKSSLMLNIFLSAFVGIHLAGAQLSLKQFYLWKNNPRFRGVLMGAFLILAGAFTLILTILFAFSVKDKWLFLCVPICSTIFAAQFVLEKSMLSRILVSGFPIAVSQVSWLGLSEAFYLIPIMIGAVFVIRRMYSPDFFRETGYLDLTSINQAQLSNSKPKLIIAVNHLVSLALSRAINQGRSTIDWAVSMPHSKLALLTAAQLATIIPFFIFIGSINEDNPKLVETFVSLFTATICISVTMECRLLFFQLRPLSHLFSNNNHRELKKKILFAVDKIIITNASIMLVGSILLSFLFNLIVDLKSFLLMVSMITLVSLVFSPILLCLKWIKVSFPQVGILVLYGASLFGIAKLFQRYEPEVGTSVASLIFISTVIIARLATRRLFWSKPLEQLLKIA